MAFLGRRRRDWWRDYPLFAALDWLMIAALLAGVALAVAHRPRDLGISLIAVPLWLLRNAYIRPRAYRKLGVDPAHFTATPVAQLDDGRQYLGMGVWRSRHGWEPVEVIRLADGWTYTFATLSGWVYGEKLGGYGADELLTLYLTRKLSLNPDLVAQFTGDAPAVIRGPDGAPLFAEAPAEFLQLISPSLARSRRSERLWKRSDTPLGSVAIDNTVAEVRMRSGSNSVILNARGSLSVLRSDEFVSHVATGDLVISAPIVDRLSGGTRVAMRIDDLLGAIPDYPHAGVLFDRVEKGELPLDDYLAEIAVHGPEWIRERYESMSKTTTRQLPLTEERRYNSIAGVAFDRCMGHIARSGDEALFAAVAHLAALCIPDGSYGELFSLTATHTADKLPTLESRATVLVELADSYSESGDTDTASWLLEGVRLDLCRQTE